MFKNDKNKDISYSGKHKKWDALLSTIYTTIYGATQKQLNASPSIGHNYWKYFLAILRFPDINMSIV